MSNRYGPRIVTDGLVCCLDAADRNSYPGTGTTWYDLSGNNCHLTLTNANSPGFSNNSFVFTGDGNYMYFSNGSVLDSALTGSVSFTIELVISATNGGIIIDNGNINTDPTDRMELYPNATRRNNRTNFSYSSQDIINTGFRHVAITKNGLNISWHHEGLFTNTDDIDGNYVGGSQLWKIGRLAHNYDLYGGLYFEGSISVIRIYNYILSSTNILNNYNATKGRFGL